MFAIRQPAHFYIISYSTIIPPFTPPVIGNYTAHVQTQLYTHLVWDPILPLIPIVSRIYSLLYDYSVLSFAVRTPTIVQLYEFTKRMPKTLLQCPIPLFLQGKK